MGHPVVSDACSRLFVANFVKNWPSVRRLQFLVNLPQKDLRFAINTSAIFAVE